MLAGNQNNDLNDGDRRHVENNQRRLTGAKWPSSEGQPFNPHMTVPKNSLMQSKDRSMCICSR